MRDLSKSKLLSYRQCPKRLWLEVKGPRLPEPDAPTQALFDGGHQVGELAQRLYDPKHKGVVFEPKRQGYEEVIADTARLVANHQPLFEAGFAANGARAYVDVLLPLRKKGQQVWRLVEVKSAGSVAETHKDDVAIQAYLARSTGLTLHSVAIAHIDTKWVYQGDGDYQGFLKEVDQTEEARVHQLMT